MGQLRPLIEELSQLLLEDPRVTASLVRRHTARKRAHSAAVAPNAKKAAEVAFLPKREGSKIGKHYNVHTRKHHNLEDPTPVTTKHHFAKGTDAGAAASDAGTHPAIVTSSHQWARKASHAADQAHATAKTPEARAKAAKMSGVAAREARKTAGVLQQTGYHPLAKHHEKEAQRHLDKAREGGEDLPAYQPEPKDNADQPGRHKPTTAPHKPLHAPIAKGKANQATAPHPRAAR